MMAVYFLFLVYKPTAAVVGNIPGNVMPTREVVKFDGESQCFREQRVPYYNKVES